jgi:hypothetical protein
VVCRVLVGRFLEKDIVLRSQATQRNTKLALDEVKLFRVPSRELTKRHSGIDRPSVFDTEFSKTASPVIDPSDNKQL